MSTMSNKGSNQPNDGLNEDAQPASNPSLARSKPLALSVHEHGSEKHRLGFLHRSKEVRQSTNPKNVSDRETMSKRQMREKKLPIDWMWAGMIGP